MRNRSFVVVDRARRAPVMDLLVPHWRLISERCADGWTDGEIAADLVERGIAVSISAVRRFRLEQRIAPGLWNRPRRITEGPPDRTPVTVTGDVVEEWSGAWGVRVDWMPRGSIVWFPKSPIIRRDPDDPRRFTVPTWFSEQIARKVQCT